MVPEPRYPLSTVAGGGVCVGSEPDALAEALDEARLFSLVVVRARDDVVRGVEHHAFALLFDPDEAGVFQVRKGDFESVDVGVDGRANLEDAHPVLRAVGKRDEYLDFDLVTVVVLGLDSHTHNWGAERFTCTGGAAARRRCGGRAAGGRIRGRASGVRHGSRVF